MKTIEFTAFGTPKGQPRPRSFAKKIGAKWMARVYDSSTAEGWKNQVAMAAQPHLPPTPLESPVNVRLAFRFARPKGHLTKHGSIKGSAPLYHVQKPDADNAAKAVLDALTILGIWKDDCQIVSLKTTKEWVAAGQAGVQVVISEFCE